MTIHTQLSAQSTRTFSKDSDEDITPQATPRATPKPTGLRATIRALSRQKSGTPGFTSRQGEKTQFNQSVRSQGSSVDNYQQIKAQAKGASQLTVPPAGSKIEIRTRTVHMQDDDLTPESDTVENLTFAYSQRDLQGRQEADGKSQDFDPYLSHMRGSPNSITSGISCESRSAIFFESTETFYSVCPYIGDEQKLNWKNYELFNLVEECFQKKVTEDYVLRIIYSRRKSDPRAKRFLQSSPVKAREMIRFGGPGEDLSICVSS